MILESLGCHFMGCFLPAFGDDCWESNCGGFGNIICARWVPCSVHVYSNRIVSFGKHAKECSLLLAGAKLDFMAKSLAKSKDGGNKLTSQ